jgi:hypothetical protein
VWFHLQLELNEMRQVTTTWQKREMTPTEYKAALKALNLNTASAGRFLGRSTRTSHRYGRGETEIPQAEALLLRAMIEFRAAPLVPEWSADRNKHW